MAFREKLNRLKPHLSQEGEKGQPPKSVESRQKLEIPFLADWGREQIKPYYYDGAYCFIREKEFSIHEQYGKYRFTDFFQAVKGWEGADIRHPLSASGFSPEQFFFFDTETTGLGGGTGNTIFLLGYAFFKGDKVIVRQHLLPHPGAEIPLYQSFLEGIDYRTLVTYNGKAFDWPQVKTRHTLIREHVPKLPPFGHFDLFHAARRLWKHKLERLKLSIVEKEVLEIERKDDIPGFLAPMIYFDFVENKKPDGIMGILKHNEMDILSLIPLYTHISFQLLNMDEARSISEGYEVGRWFSALGESAAATENLSLYKSENEGDALKAKYLLALERKKQKQWKEACQLWENLLQGRDEFLALQSSIELAKYYEHRKHDIVQAIHFTREAKLTFAAGLQLPKDKEQYIKGELEKRMKRLQQKLHKISLSKGEMTATMGEEEMV